MYQFGLLKNLDEKSRKINVTEKQRQYYGNVGLASVCQGDEILGSYIGGGEGFFWGDNAYRVTKGGSVFKVNHNEGYWFAQMMNFNHPVEIFDTESHVAATKTFFSIEQVAEYVFLKLKIGPAPFMATFSASFDKKNFMARSNGVFPTDSVSNSQVNIFEQDFYTEGGHLLSHESEITIFGSIFVQLINEIYRV